MNDLHNSGGSIYKNRTALLRHCIIGILILAIFFLMLSLTSWKGNIFGLYSGTNGYEDTEWTLWHNGEVLAEFPNQPKEALLAQGESYALSTILTYDAQKDSAPYVFFRVYHMFCRVLLDGEEIFHYSPYDFSHSDLIRSPGNLYTSVSLPSNCKGKVFTLEFIPGLDTDIPYQLPRMFFGDYPTMMHFIFMDDIPHNTVALITGFIGLVAIIFSAVTLSKKYYRRVLFLGIFSLLFCVFSLTRSLFFLHLFSSPYYAYIINLTCYSLMPIFMLAYYRESFSQKYKRPVLFFIFAGIILWLSQEIMHFCGICELKTSLFLTHAFYGITLSTLLFMLLRMGRNTRRKQLLVQLIPVIIGIAADYSVNRQHLRISQMNLEFTSTGIIIFILLEIYFLWKESVQIYADAASSRYYQNMALVDSLTGIGNHRAFEEKKDALKSGQNNCVQLCVISADVNDLKIVNDTKGHTAGDQLIKTAARVLENLCRNRGSAFRTGGDEFMAFLWNVSKDEFNQLYASMEQEINELNQYTTLQFSMAIGWVYTDPAQVEDAILIADGKMYENKRNHKLSRIETHLSQ